LKIRRKTIANFVFAPYLCIDLKSSKFKMILKFINRFWHLLFGLLEVLLLILVMFWLMVTPMVAENIVYVLLLVVRYFFIKPQYALYL